MSTENSLSLIESLPQELFAEILARVASSSVEDISHCLTVSRTISSTVQDDHAIKRLNLRPQAMNPMITFYRYQHLMVKAINSNNPAAHYTEGIKQFFAYDNRTVGLLHLKKSAEGSYDNGTYLYGIVVSCMGNIEEEKTILRTLGWEASRRRTNRARREIKRSMRFAYVILKPEYTATLKSNQPPFTWHKNDKDNICPSCFHYKMMRKFVGFVRQNI
ncbi:F-box protein At2g35280-like [Brassica rapa]|uniref:F-box protein At2g35280-like n=1 Tax=Brassica campestris TaxID=3711 RepID=UPI00142D9DEF|nr:F-box protein At2g35280-like [Brassica rapa]